MIFTTSPKRLRAGCPRHWLALLLIHSAAAGPLRLEPFDGPSANFKEHAGTIEIRGALSIRAIPATPPTAADQVLELEYFCAGGVPPFAALPGPPFEAKTARMFPEMGHSETWTSYATRLTQPGLPLPAGWQQLRFDLPLPADRVLQLRNVRLRPETPGEFDVTTSTPAASAPEKSLEEYFARKFPATVSKVSVGKDLIRIEGNSGKQSGQIFLADIPLDVVLDDARSWETLVALKPELDGSFVIDVPRKRQRDGLDYDRLVSRWQLVRKTTASVEPLSHARYAEWVDCRSPGLPAAKPKNKKGLGGWNMSQLPNELADLGISAVTVNMMVHELGSLQPGADTVPHVWQGKTYHMREKAFANYDKTFLEANNHGAMVSVILLIANPAEGGGPDVKLLGHPDAVKQGVFAMPNITSAEGISYYGAILDFMAERWSRTDGKHGRVHHYIIHNEVDAGWVWTNAGDKPAIVYLDLYQRSMRLTDLIVRQYDPHARAFITLTHHWAHPGGEHWYGSKRLVDLLVKFTQVEGDFPWAMAYHPYPQNLFKPRAWEDEQATFSFETEKITPKNLEVLDAYMKQPALLYHGKVRPVHLSENGFNSEDYSDKAMEDQAAGMAMAWKKMAALSSIQSWQYHNWIDNRGEGGLKIGLRKFPDEKGDPLGKKPIWHLYQALGTPKEDEVAKPYLKTIGIKSWDEAIYKETIR